MLTLEVLGVGEELHELELRGEPLPVPAPRLQTRLRGVDVHGLAWARQNCLRKLSGISGKFRVPRKVEFGGIPCETRWDLYSFPNTLFRDRPRIGPPQESEREDVIDRFIIDQRSRTRAHTFSSEARRPSPDPDLDPPTDRNHNQHPTPPSRTANDPDDLGGTLGENKQITSTSDLRGTMGGGEQKNQHVRPARHLGKKQTKEPARPTSARKKKQYIRRGRHKKGKESQKAQGSLSNKIYEEH